MKTTEYVCCVMLVCEIDELSTAIYHKHGIVQQSTFANCKSNMPRASLAHQIVIAAVGGGRRGVLIRSHRQIPRRRADSSGTALSTDKRPDCMCGGGGGTEHTAITNLSQEGVNLTCTVLYSYKIPKRFKAVRLYHVLQ